MPMVKAQHPARRSRRHPDIGIAAGSPPGQLVANSVPADQAAAVTARPRMRSSRPALPDLHRVKAVTCAGHSCTSRRSARTRPTPTRPATGCCCAPGFIRQLMAGHYSLLPLGMRVRAKVIAIIREEMNAIGGAGVPAAVDAAGLRSGRRSGRLDVMGEEMFRLKDRKGADVVLGMTHEEIFTTLATELSLLPGAAPVLVPVPGQVPRRAAAQERADPGARVHHEGLLQLRPRRGRAGRVLRGAPRRLRADLRPARHPGVRGRGLQREHGRQRLAGVHVPDRRPARTWSPGARTATTPPTWRRPPRPWPPVTDEPGPDAPVRLDTPGVRTIEDLAQRLRPGRRPADQDAGPGHRRPADPGAAARRPPAGRPEAHRRHRRDRHPARPARRDRRRARRLARQPGRGRRHRPAGHRRPGAAGPDQHGHRRQHRRRPPHRRGRGPGHHRRPAGPTCARWPRASRARAAARRWS